MDIIGISLGIDEITNISILKAKILAVADMVDTVEVKISDKLFDNFDL